MPRRFITCKENNFVFNLEDKTNVVTREPSIIDPFYFDEGICNETGEKTVVCCDPLIMLFNQERLNQMGDAAVKMWIDSMSKSNASAMNELKAKLSDDELIQLVKSRHIQSPSELQAYIEWCNENVDEFTKEVQTLQAHQQSEQTDDTETKTQ